MSRKTPSNGCGTENYLWVTASRLDAAWVRAKRRRGTASDRREMDGFTTRARAILKGRLKAVGAAALVAWPGTIVLSTIEQLSTSNL